MEWEGLVQRPEVEESRNIYDREIFSRLEPVEETGATIPQAPGAGGALKTQDFPLEAIQSPLRIERCLFFKNIIQTWQFLQLRRND